MPQFKRANDESLNELRRKVYTCYGALSIRANEGSIYEQRVEVYISKALLCCTANGNHEDEPIQMVMTGNNNKNPRPWESRGYMY